MADCVIVLSIENAPVETAALKSPLALFLVGRDSIPENGMSGKKPELPHRSFFFSDAQWGMRKCDEQMRIADERNPIPPLRNSSPTRVLLHEPAIRLTRRTQ
ncbi:MAG: hypothetical protein GX422_05005 [Deltaproteobacteria bacterium]|nr:hypothetical protein [Deltaproteobacteria bacterium]